MLRQSVFGRLAGYQDVNDAERLRHDPAMRWIVGGKAACRCAASASQMGRFETRWLTGEKNLSALANLSGQWIDRVHARRTPRGVVLDMDSSVSPTHGEQEMSVWNGHYECTCYHPLFVFNQFGDLERCALRPGNVHSADGWENVLKPVVARYRGKPSRIYFRADAGFANPDVYEYLEGQGIKYAIRLPANRILQERIGYLLKRPVGRPSLDVRREGRQPRPLCRIPDGGGRDPEKPLCRRLAAHRRTAAAAGRTDSVKRLVVTRSTKSPGNKSHGKRCVLIAKSSALSTFDLVSACLSGPGSFSSLVFDGPSGIPAGENV